MNIFRSKKKHDQILPLLTAMYNILCTRRLQPPRDDCAVRAQWFSSVIRVHFVKIVKRHLYLSSYQWLGNIDMHMFAKCDQRIPC